MNFNSILQKITSTLNINQPQQQQPQQQQSYAQQSYAQQQSYPQQYYPPQSQPQPQYPHQLPVGWIAQYDNNYQRYFYINTATQHTQWEYPTPSTSTTAIIDKPNNVSLVYDPSTHLNNSTVEPPKELIPASQPSENVTPSHQIQISNHPSENLVYNPIFDPVSNQQSMHVNQQINNSLTPPPTPPSQSQAYKTNQQ